MQKIILVTGATDGIGLETAKMLVSQNHHVLLHGRNEEKLKKLEQALSSLPGTMESYLADLSIMADVQALAKAVMKKHTRIDVVINNAGVYTSRVHPVTKDGLDVRFAVNTIAPYLLTQQLLPLLKTTTAGAARVVNVSWAAQAPVDLKALAGKSPKMLSDGTAYAQSKLALTMWSRSLGLSFKDKGGPMICSVNPGSMLGTNMVKDAFGVTGANVTIGADILVRAALSDEFAHASGQYYNNDSHRFASPHPDALDPKKCSAVVRTIEDVLSEKLT